MIAVTAATGQLGGLVVDELLKTTEAGKIVAAVRTPAKATTLAERGVEVREADYSRPETLATAFQGVTCLLLISGTDPGKRQEQHEAVIDAAKAAGVTFIAYTSVLHCDTSPLKLAKDHLATEQSLRASGVAYALLRNGWYFENQTAAIQPAIQHGALIGTSGDGKFAAAARRDYAAAAAKVLTGDEHRNSVLELGGDASYSLTELAAEISKQTGKAVEYRNLPQSDYQQILGNFLPAEIAGVVADAEAHAEHGALDDTSHTLSRLLGRPTSTLAEAVAAALATPPATH